MREHFADETLYLDLSPQLSQSMRISWARQSSNNHEQGQTDMK